MFIAIIGTRLSGKSTVQEYLINFKGFKALCLLERDGSASPLVRLRSTGSKRGLIPPRMKTILRTLVTLRRQLCRPRKVLMMLTFCKWILLCSTRAVTGRLLFS